MTPHWHRKPGTARVTLVSLLACALLVGAIWSPAPCAAARLATDEIAGVTLAESGLADRAPDINAASGMLIGPDGRVLWARDADGRRAMASITKLMTAIVVLERADLDDAVTVSQAASQVPYATGLVAGERRTVRELLELALVASSNDAAHALAEHLGPGVDAFVGLMNARAAEAGLRGTHFANPHGLDAAGHYSRANDIATLSAIALEFPEYRRIVALESVTLPAYATRTAPKTVESTDHLLGVYDGLLGGKTGFTDDADYCFAGCAERDGLALTAIVLGARTSDARFAETSRLLDWGFENLTFETVATTTETVAAVPLAANPGHTVELQFAETTRTPVFALDGPITRRLDTEPSVGLPVFEGQLLGEVTLVQGERELATLPLVASRDIASAEETVGLVPVSDYLDRTVLARASADAIDVPAFDPEVPVERTVLLDADVDAPVSQGDRVGTIAYAQDGEVFLEVPAVATEAVPAPSALERVGIWFQRAVRWITGAPTMASPELVSG